METNKFGLTTAQQFTIDNLKRGQTTTLVVPETHTNRTRNGREIQKTVKKVEITHCDKETGHIYVTTGSRGRTFTFKEIFEKTKLRVVQPEQETPIDVDPDKATVNKIKKFGVVKYEYYQGGFPSSCDLHYQHKNDDKVERLAEKIFLRTEIIKLAKGAKAIFGSRCRPYETFLKKAKEICLPEEVTAIENYDHREETRTNFKW